MAYGFKNDISNLVISHKLKVMLDKCSVFNVLAEEIYFLKKCIFWIEVTRQISTFQTFHCLSEVGQIPHVIFKTRIQFLHKLYTIL